MLAPKGKRKLNRANIQVEDLAGRFRLLLGERRLELIQMKDISINGAGVLLSEPVEVGKEIKLSLTAGDWELTVGGTVVWCRMMTDLSSPRQSWRYRLGIRFDPANTHNNVLFYMAAKTLQEQNSSTA